MNKIPDIRPKSEKELSSAKKAWEIKRLKKGLKNIDNYKDQLEAIKKLKEKYQKEGWKR